jgi:hypothetical protein
MNFPEQRRPEESNGYPVEFPSLEHLGRQLDAYYRNTLVFAGSLATTVAGLLAYARL